MQRLFPVALLALAACATVDPDPVAREIEAGVAPRIGQQLQWGRAGAAEIVGRLLESPLSADAAVQIALLENRRLQAEYEALGIAQADLVQAGLLENPVFSGDVLFDGGTKATLGITQNLLSLLTLAANRTTAASGFEQAKAELGQRMLDLVFDVRAAYYRLLADEQAVGLFRQVVGASEAAAELAQRQQTAGNATVRDQALRQAQYAQSALELSRAEARLAADREALNKLMGLWGERVAWNLPDRLADLPATKPALDGLEALAVERRLDLAAARHGLDRATYAAELGRQLRFLSPLGIGVAAEREADGSWRKGPSLEFGLPIFDRGEARIAKLEAQQRAAADAMAAMAVELRADVRAAWVRLVAAHDAARFYRDRVLPLQEQIVGETQRLYNGMLIGVYDLLRTRQDQIEAARGYIEALRDYWVARAELERAIAGPLPHSS